MTKKVEILAPAGSWESMAAAVCAGADAVYMGGSRFGARAFADNPEEDRFLEAIDYVHLHGRRIYMTVNTLVKEGELDSLFDFMKPYYARGLDAAIVQDLGVLALLRRCFPELSIHASTQMTITGMRGARVLKELGASRIVTARELSLEEIAAIHREVDIEIESFVHGALCYCYSGQCLMSSLIGGRSGNRGRCAQPCRLPYEVNDNTHTLTDRKDRYVLSLKDLCTLDLIPQILKSGVTSLKIEGRMKSPRYTAGVVSVYRKYVDRYLEYGESDYRVDKKDRDMLLELFDRGGFSSGYYERHNGQDMVALKEKPSFREGNQALFDYLDDTYVKAGKKEPVTGVLTLREGEAASLSLTRSEEGRTTAVLATGEIPQTAKNQPLTEDKLRERMNKTGDSAFYFESLEIKLYGDLFLPVQALNQLRRDGLSMLQERILSAYQREEKTVAHRSAGAVLLSGEHREFEFAVLLERPDMLKPVLESGIVDLIYLESASFSSGQWREIVSACHRAGKRCALAFAHIFRREAEDYYNERADRLRKAGFDGYLVRNLETVDFIKEQKLRAIVVSDTNLYAMNHLARFELAALGMGRLTLPMELNRRELKELGTAGSEMIVYGNFPVMVSAQCIAKTTSGCDKKPGTLNLKDRMQKTFPVKKYCKFCYNVIDNTTPLSLLSQREEIKSLGPSVLRMQFTSETEQEIRAVLHAFEAAFLLGQEAGEPVAEFTRGHFKRGVE